MGNEFVVGGAGLVKQKTHHGFVGYCVSTSNEGMTGEIDSVFIDSVFIDSVFVEEGKV